MEVHLEELSIKNRHNYKWCITEYNIIDLPFFSAFDTKLSDLIEDLLRVRFIKADG